MQESYSMICTNSESIMRSGELGRGGDNDKSAHCITYFWNYYYVLHIIMLLWMKNGSIPFHKGLQLYYIAN